MRKIMTLVLALFLTISSFAQTKVFAEDKLFSDISSNYDYSEAIYYLRDEGVVKGFGDSTFKPNQPVTRAEFVKIMVNSLYPEEIKAYTKNNCFRDVSTKDPLSVYICFAKDKNLVSGYEDGRFDPYNSILFQEASKIILNASGNNLQSSEKDWEKPYLKEMSNLKNIPRTVVSPRKVLTRGEMSEIMVRMLKKDVTYDSLTYNSTQNTISFTPNKITSCSELQEILGKYNRPYPILYDAMRDLPVSSEKAVEESAGATQDGDYSTTNVQVDGVDEGDIIKNDAENIYMIRGNKVSIAKIYPGKEMKALSTMDLSKENFTADNLYLDGNYMIVLGNTYLPYTVTNSGVAEKMMMPYFQSTSEVRVYNVSDPSKPVLDRTVKYSGYIVTSRLIDHQIYLVLNSSPNYWLYENSDSANNLALPEITDVKVEKEVKNNVECSDISYIPPFSSPQYLLTSSFKVDNSDSEIYKDVILGGGGNVYSSKNNIYITESVYNSYLYPVDVMRSYLPDSPRTIINKFTLNDGKIQYSGQGKVDGTVINQFSMDESGDSFRIATHTDTYSPMSTTSSNNVFVLDKNLNKTGEIRNIANGEQIYSTRFIGKRLYMVTFKNVDPLFVIDLSSPTDPKILGELKIPGYSTYLHPYDENHIIGFGKDASESSGGIWGNNFAWYQGMKIALFDVTDVNNPKEMFKESIGDRGTDSELLWNHKALLFNKDKNLLAFPVTVYELKDKTNNSPMNYGEPVFQGAYIYNLDLKTGFTLKAKKSNYDNYQTYLKNQNYATNYVDKNINRIIYVKDSLYTIAPDMLKSFELSTLTDQKTLTF